MNAPRPRVAAVLLLLAVAGRAAAQAEAVAPLSTAADTPMPTAPHPTAAHAPAAPATVAGAAGESSVLPQLDAKPQRRFAEAGDTRVNFLLGYANDFDETQIAQGGVGLSWFVIDSLSLDLELLGMGVFQPEQDAAGLDANLLFRWHFWQNEARTISVYGDAGVGLAGFTEDVPPDGTSFNFVPQVGFGASFEIASDTRLMAGVRWLHLSNARLSSGNPGIDSALVYVGLSVGF